MNLDFTDFFEETNFNSATKNQLWMSQLADSHDNICKCDTPFCHLLASIFPPGHQDRNLTINEILSRDYKEKCRSGGKEEKETGGAATDTAAEGPVKQEKEEDFTRDEIDELLAAVTEEERR